MHDHNPKYRPSFIEENPALLISLLLLGAYLLAMVVAKYAWFIHDEQLVEWSLWLLLGGVSAFVGIYQLTRAKSARDQAWPNQIPTIPTRREREIVERSLRRTASCWATTSMGNRGLGRTKRVSCKRSFSDRPAAERQRFYATSSART